VSISSDRGVELADPSVASITSKRYVGRFKVLARHHDRELFRHQVGFAFATDACGINEAKASAAQARTISSTASRVVPGIGETIERSAPVKQIE